MFECDSIYIYIHIYIYAVDASFVRLIFDRSRGDYYKYGLNDHNVRLGSAFTSSRGHCTCTAVPNALISKLRPTCTCFIRGMRLRAKSVNYVIHKNPGSQEN